MEAPPASALRSPDSSKTNSPVSSPRRSNDRSSRSPLEEDIRKLMTVAHGQPPDASFSPKKRTTRVESTGSSETAPFAKLEKNLEGEDEDEVSDSIPIPHSSTAAETLSLPFSPSALTTALVEHRNSFQQHQHIHHQLQNDRLNHNLQLASNIGGGLPAQHPSPPAPSSVSSTPLGPSLYPLVLTPRISLPSLDVEVSIRFVHPETRKRRIVKAVIPLQREVSINESSFDYITAGQLVHALGTNGGIDLQRWRVEIPDGIEHDYAEEAVPVPCCAGPTSSISSSSSSSSSRDLRPRYVPLEMDAKGADATGGEGADATASDERLPLSIMFLPRGGGALLFIDIRLVERASSLASSSSSASSSLSSSTSSLSSQSAAAHALKLGREGRAWMFGRDWNRTPHHRPFLLKDLSVVDISCGSSHFLALTSTPFVCSCHAPPHTPRHAVADGPSPPSLQRKATCSRGAGSASWATAPWRTSWPLRSCRASTTITSPRSPPAHDTRSRSPVRVRSRNFVGRFLTERSRAHGWCVCASRCRSRGDTGVGPGRGVGRLPGAGPRVPNAGQDELAERNHVQEHQHGVQPHRRRLE